MWTVSDVLCLAWTWLTIVCTVRATPTVYQISQYNTDVGAKAIDGNITTCSLSGYHTKPWYVLDFGADTTISTVKIAGIARHLEIMMKPNDNMPVLAQGEPSRMEFNLTCKKYGTDYILNNTQALTQISCAQPVTGRWLGIFTTYIAPYQLKLCDVMWS